MRFFRLMTLTGTPSLARVGPNGWERYDYALRSWLKSHEVEAHVLFSGDWEEVGEADVASNIHAWNTARLSPVG